MIREPYSLITMACHILSNLLFIFLPNVFPCTEACSSNYVHLVLKFLIIAHLLAGLELLLGLLGSASLKQQLDGAVALYKLANKAMALSPVDAAPPSPTPQVDLL